jgi:endogenous inhibitor of DNA gyrase (YacG/DUF329 family)
MGAVIRCAYCQTETAFTEKEMNFRQGAVQRETCFSAKCPTCNRTLFAWSLVDIAHLLKEEVA